MNKRRVQKLPALLLCILTAPASASVITNVVGDVDNLGGAITSGATSFPSTTFDNRSAAESGATNGAQWTDWSNSSFGIDLPGAVFLANPTFTHSFAAFTSITSATWEIGVGGIQTQNERLFLDELLIASGTDFPEQGPNGYGIISFSITGAALSELLDGTAAFRVNLNSNDDGEPVVFDYAKLTIDGVLRGANNNIPEPATLALMGLGFAGLGYRRRKQTTA